MNGVDKVVDLLLEYYFNEDGTLVDPEYFKDSIMLIVENTQYLHNWMYESSRRSHTIAYEGLIELLSVDLGERITSPQLKAAFKRIGTDFKEILKPTVDEIEERRNDIDESKEIVTEGKEDLQINDTIAGIYYQGTDKSKLKDFSNCNKYKIGELIGNVIKSKVHGDYTVKSGPYKIIGYGSSKKDGEGQGFYIVKGIRGFVTSKEGQFYKKQDNLTSITKLKNNGEVINYNYKDPLRESKEDVKYNVYVLAGGEGVYNSHLVDTVDSEEQAVDRVAEVGAEEGSNAYYVKVVNGKEVEESKKISEGKLKKDNIISGYESYLEEIGEEADELNLSDYMTDIFYDLEDEDDMNEANEAEEELKKKYNLKGDISDFISDEDDYITEDIKTVKAIQDEILNKEDEIKNIEAKANLTFTDKQQIEKLKEEIAELENKIKTEAKDTDYIIVKQTSEGPLYMNGKSTSFDKKNAQIFNSEEEAREALHDYKENVVDPEANEFKIARLNEFKEQLGEGIEIECNEEDLIESVDIAKVMDQINELESQLEMMENEKDIDQAEVKKVKDKITRLSKKLDEAKMVEAVDNEKDEINLKEIRTILERSGIKSERTLDLMSKDILKDLKNNYADDCNIDGIFPGVVIVDAFQKKVEQITGRKPQLKFGEDKEVSNEDFDIRELGNSIEKEVKKEFPKVAYVQAVDFHGEPFGEMDFYLDKEQYNTKNKTGKDQGNGCVELKVYNNKIHPVCYTKGFYHNGLFELLDKKYGFHQEFDLNEIDKVAEFIKDVCRFYEKDSKDESLTESKFDKCQATLPLDAYHAIGIIVSDNGETVQYMYSNDEDSVYESEIEYDEEGNPFFKDEDGNTWKIDEFMRTNYGETKSKRIYANKEIEKPEILNEDLTAAEVLKRDLPIYLKTNEGYMELSIDEAPEKPEDYDEGYIAGWNKGEDPAFDAEQELKYKEAMDAFNEGEVYQFRQVADDIIYTICYGDKELDEMLRQLNATIVNIEDLMK